MCGYETQTDLTAITDPVLFQDIPVQGNCNNGKMDRQYMHYTCTVHVACTM